MATIACPWIGGNVAATHDPGCPGYRLLKACGIRAGALSAYLKRDGSLYVTTVWRGPARGGLRSGREGKLDLPIINMHDMWR